MVKFDIIKSMKKQKINEYRLIAYVGEEADGQGFTEMEFNPFEYAVIFKDSQDNEIWLDPDCLEKMAEQLKEFAEKLKLIINTKPTSQKQLTSRIKRNK